MVSKEPMKYRRRMNFGIENGVVPLEGATIRFEIGKEKEQEHIHDHSKNSNR